jgi:hypothetical protein
LFQWGDLSSEKCSQVKISRTGGESIRICRWRFEK